MGFFNSDSRDSDTGRTSAEGGNGNVRSRAHTADGKHEAIRTPNLDAVRSLHSGTRGYAGRHRSK